MTWLKGFIAYIKTALGTVAETSGVFVVAGWFGAVRQSLPARPAWLTKALRGLSSICGATWRSFWAAWANPMTYPIIALVALTMFVTGHHEGRRPVASARNDAAAAKRERDVAVARANKADAALALANGHIATLTALPAVVVPAAVPDRKVVRRPVAPRKRKARAAGTVKPAPTWLSW